LRSGYAITLKLKAASLAAPAEEGIELLKPVPNNLLQKWPVAKRVNSSRADDDDPTLIEKVELTAAS
jgi:putative SOS response-associated peptidase YedK